jgi:hypothetical protein
MQNRTLAIAAGPDSAKGRAHCAEIAVSAKKL